MLSYDVITVTDIPALVVTAFALWTLTRACFSNPLSTWIQSRIYAIDKTKAEPVKVAQFELSKGATVAALENVQNGQQPKRLTSSERIERQEIIQAYRMPLTKRLLIYPFTCQLCQAFWVSFLAYLFVGTDGSTWFMSPLMYAGLILLLSRVMPDGVTPTRAISSGPRRRSCGG